jgi:hypothetical protein
LLSGEGQELVQNSLLFLGDVILHANSDCHVSDCGAVNVIDLSDASEGNIVHDNVHKSLHSCQEQ